MFVCVYWEGSKANISQHRRFIKSKHKHYTFSSYVSLLGVLEPWCPVDYVVLVWVVAATRAWPDVDPESEVTPVYTQGRSWGRERRKEIDGGDGGGDDDDNDDVIIFTGCMSPINGSDLKSPVSGRNGESGALHWPTDVPVPSKHTLVYFRRMLSKDETIQFVGHVENPPKWSISIGAKEITQKEPIVASGFRKPDQDGAVISCWWSIN